MSPPVLRLALTTRAGLSGPALSVEDLLPGERARLAARRHDDARERFVDGRRLLRQLASVPPDIDAHGRSTLPSGHINLSHSGDWLFAGASARPIGVDLEVLRPRRGDLIALSRQVHGDAQCAEIGRLLAAGHDSDALAVFYGWWTLKEAWLKCRGRGLDFALMRSLEFHPQDDTTASAMSATSATSDDRPADCACARVDGLGLMLAVVVDPGVIGRGLRCVDLPAALAGEPLRWRLLESCF
ncbi:4'-phosphopantetheinyl transferase superfamily protein [Mitsuaria sp. 7]|uniref:4'-phosphopantetheinyl transferase family protein n=1 Tax=Mitsuaria sp. 7 TaxID=1658665 RepID=UPI00082B24D8|nr:4'-phosphopantetheinyl transferase superfamily protein [Mitsuaria sp. 7]